MACLYIKSKSLEFISDWRMIVWLYVCSGLSVIFISSSCAKQQHVENLVDTGRELGKCDEMEMKSSAFYFSISWPRRSEDDDGWKRIYVGGREHFLLIQVRHDARGT
jgi:hypothetical protein